MNVDLTTHYLGILFRRLEALSAPRGFCGFGNKLGLELSANLRALNRND
jgi:hypothetical protein